MCVCKHTCDLNNLSKRSSGGSDCSLKSEWTLIWGAGDWETLCSFWFTRVGKSSSVALLLLLPTSWHVLFLLRDAKGATLRATLTKIIGKMLNKRLQIYFVLCHTNINNHYVYLCAIQNVTDLCCWWTPLITEKLAEALANKCYVCVASGEQIVGWLVNPFRCVYIYIWVCV